MNAKNRIKRFAALLMAALLIFALAGCSFDTGTTKPISGKTDKSAKKENATIEEQVCFEHDGIRVTAKALTTSAILGTGLQLLVENDSDKEYSVSTHEVIINDCMNSTLFSCSVPAGKKANDTLYFSSTSLEKAGITRIGKIEIAFYVYDSSTFQTVYEPERAVIHTSLYTDMDRVSDEGTELYNEGGIRIVGKTVDEDALLGASILLYIENQTARNIVVSCADLSVNGFVVTALLSCDVKRGKCAVDDITVLSGSLDENGITKIENFELAFHIFDSDTFHTVADTDSIRVTLD